MARPNPKWPWIGCAVFLVSLVVSIHRMGVIEEEFRPLWDEHMQRSSAGPSAQMQRAIASGDFNYGMQVLTQERDSNDFLRVEMAFMEARYEKAITWRNLSIGGLIVFALFWFISSLAGKRAPCVSPAT